MRPKHSDKVGHAVLSRPGEDEKGVVLRIGGAICY